MENSLVTRPEQIEPVSLLDFVQGSFEPLPGWAHVVAEGYRLWSDSVGVGVYVTPAGAEASSSCSSTMLPHHHHLLYASHPHPRSPVPYHLSWKVCRQLVI